MINTIERMNYITRKEAADTLKVHYNTIYGLAKIGKIKSVKIGKQTRYEISDYLNEIGIEKERETRRRICYCRVSSKKQKMDLINQIEYMKRRYPEHEIISEIGSGLNYNRKGLKKILDYGIKGEIDEVVIAYRDRLVRYGYEIYEHVIKKYSKGEIKVLKKEKKGSVMEEISKDILSIMNIYVAKINGLRRYGRIKVRK